MKITIYERKIKSQKSSCSCIFSSLEFLHTPNKHAGIEIKQVANATDQLKTMQSG
jgi:hypothetical protein